MSVCVQANDNYATMQRALSANKTGAEDRGEEVPVSENVRLPRPVIVPV